MDRLPEGALMQRAATGLAVAIADLLGSTYAARVLLLVGSRGQRGRRAVGRRGAGAPGCLGRGSAAVLEGARGGLAALRAAGGRTVLRADARQPDVVVDGIVGIGGRPGLREEAEDALGRFPGVPVVAVDVPSGVDVDTGRLDGAHVRADLTVTFGTHKIAHLVDPAAQACGVVHLVDIGLQLPEAPVEALQPVDVAAMLPVPSAFAHKYTRGVVGVRAGSETYPGAAVLCTSGAGTGLAGMVRYWLCGRRSACRHPEVVTPRAGCRRGSSDPVATRTPRGRWPRRWRTGCRRWSTLMRWPISTRDTGRRTHSACRRAGPHARRRAGGGRVDQLGFARRAAREYDAVVLLKGRHTLVARPDGRVRVTTSGVPWLAVAGAGDVLAGIIGIVAGGRSGSVGRGVGRVVAARCSGRSRGRWRAADGRICGRRCAGGRAGPAPLNGKMVLS